MKNVKQFAILAFAVIPLAFYVAAAPKGDPAQGKETFQQCEVCHNTDTDDAKVGPSLKGLFARKKLKSGKPVSDKSVLAQINNGGGGMPSFAQKLSQEDKDNLIAYLHTL